MNKTKELVILAFLSAILFVQEQALSFLPNIQLTVFLLILYTRTVGIKKTVFIICVYCLLDNLFMASINLIYTPFMMIGWLLVPILLETIFKKMQTSMALAFLAIVFSFLYSWVYLIPNIWIYDVQPLAYLLADLPFEVLLAASSFITTLWLYEPCSKVLRHLMK